MGDYLLYTAELFISEGDYDAGIVFIKTLVYCRILVVNAVLLNLRMAEYHIEAGDTDKGMEYLVRLCTNTVSNYEDTIEANGLTHVWEKYRPMVKVRCPSLYRI